MSLPADLARDILLDHYRHPRRFERLDRGAVSLANPSCGDRLRLAMDLRGDGTVAFRFDGSGCSISVASASMMAELLSGRSAKAAEAIAEAVLRALRGESAPGDLEGYGDVGALAGVSALPVRVKCATLAWQGALGLLETPA